MSYNSPIDIALKRVKENVKTLWRIIQSPSNSGAFNMALDEVFLAMAAQKIKPPTLRLYSWAPPALSLGYSQMASDVDFQQLERFGWDMVRRPTGGKAILHIDELTYSISASVDDPLVSGTLLESYQRISAILQDALTRLGVTTSADHRYADIPENAKTNPVCFEVPSNFEITHAGKKLVGSAQARKAGGVLQHGSLPLFGDLGRITFALQFSSIADQEAAAQKVNARAATLQQAAGRLITWEEAAHALILAFSAQPDVEVEMTQPDADEIHQAEELAQAKYAGQAWNNRL